MYRYRRRPFNPHAIKNRVEIEVDAVREEWTIAKDKIDLPCSQEQNLKWLIIRYNVIHAIHKLVRLPCVEDRRIGRLHRDTLSVLFEKFFDLWDRHVPPVLQSDTSNHYDWYLLLNVFQRIWTSLWRLNNNIEIICVE